MTWIYVIDLRITFVKGKLITAAKESKHPVSKEILKNKTSIQKFNCLICILFSVMNVKLKRAVLELN